MSNADLIRRLRGLTWRDCYERPEDAELICWEAADALEAAEARIRALDADVPDVKAVVDRAEEAEARIRELEAEVEEHEQVFRFINEADERARKRWQEAHPDQPLTWPDSADLSVWLMESIIKAEARAEAAEAEAARLREAVEPFADLCNEGAEDFPDTEMVTVKFGRTTDFTLTLGDIRRAARAALPPARRDEDR